ncbi:M13 family metallopeptidase [Corynebacterium ammoniagenes]|uniref:Metalloendopeptidase n=2 Tax=Corynebacterium ammoniagenes TaxID=1697 RepID=A0AAV5G3M2_CORAM|nr:M13-type metalloendopeptidase [Corynebacterium ammoniagenes]APT81573.1 peptidase M13 [Corynebacterium ammoniagenes DSM 20306]AQS72698.1 peptidase M13 [Corynebacterium ammoniagenes]EFG80133.1 peptidase family M13 [Corynebacterium ammoniagenes DSM 20306]GJN43648.1 metalloendopeptidase [Corynebacterium ammoniagenes]
MTQLNDLYQFVNGPWLKSHVIPDDRGVDGTFHKLRDQAEELSHEIVKEDTGRAGTVYNSYMDTDGINGAGMAPLDADLDRLSVADINEFATVIGKLERLGVSSPVTFWVEKDSGSEDCVAYIIQSGLGLPDEAYYREEAHADTLAAYQKHVEEMLEFLDPARLFGLGAQVAAERIVNLEKKIAAGHWDVVATRDAVKTYNPTEFQDLPEIVRTILTGGGLPEHRVVNMMPSYQEHLAQLLTETQLADWQLWATWAILRARAGVLPEEVGKKNFEFYGTKLTGATQQRDRWKRALGLAEGMVGQEIGKIFVDRHFPKSSKAEMDELVEYLVRAYRERISDLAWMTPETRERALEKLGKFKAKIGYPDTWRDYSGLEFSAAGADLVDNLRNGNAWAHDFELNKIGKPTDRDEWFSTPQTVNAFYNPVVNDITFPAAILRPPFYNPEADAAENFGAIGAVIGHEIGHGFDDQGSQYDGDGNLNSWWSDADRSAFENLTSKLVEQFDGEVPSVLKEAGIESNGVNGEFTLGENIGDLGGLGISVVAYRMYCEDKGLDINGQKAKFDIEGGSEELAAGEFTGLQRLFLAWARVWRTAIRPEMAKQYLAMDPHSPAEFRCNLIAANIAEFYEAFDVAEDGPMFLEEKDRVTIW